MHTKCVVDGNFTKPHKSMLRLYLLLTGGMVCSFAIFYFFGIRPLTEYLYNTNENKITYNLSKASMAFDYIVDRQKQLALQIASRTVIRNKQIDYLENKITKEELVEHSQSKLADSVQASKEVLGVSRYDNTGAFLFSAGKPVPETAIQACMHSDAKDDVGVFLLKADSASQAFLYCSKITENNFGLVGYDVLLMSDHDFHNLINKNRDITTTYVLSSDDGNLLYWPDSLDRKMVHDLLQNDKNRPSFNNSYLINQVETQVKGLKLYSIVDKSIFLSPVNGRLYTLFIVLSLASILTLIASLLAARPIFLSMVEEQRMRELSQRDMLTGLYNRRALVELFEKEAFRSRRYNRPLSMVMFDIDHFKKFNDTYGHVAGDQVLQTIGTYCLNLSRKHDFWIRYGGEEFIVLLPETDQASVATYAERLRSGIEHLKVETSKGPLSVTISGGYHSFASFDSKTELEHVINTIDKALYEAKNKGRNTMMPC